MSRRSGRRPMSAALPLVVLGLLLMTGCADRAAVDSKAARAPGVSTAPGVAATVTVTRTTVVPAPRTDISNSLGLVHDFVTGASWNRGRVPAAGAVIDVDYEASGVTGRLTYSESAGRSSYRRIQTVEARGVGNPATFEMTTRSSSSDPRTVLDVLHRAGNPHHDYLLTGVAYRSVAPTAWVTVPAVFGNGLGCGVPGRQVVCQVTADLLANQALDPSMPTNTATSSTGTGSISSAITLGQLVALDVWRLRAAVAPLATKAADLDRILIPVTLSYHALPGSTMGRPARLTINGAVTVGGVEVAIDLVWDETASGAAKEIDLPVPTKALYTVLDAAAAQRLSAIAARSE